MLVSVCCFFFFSSRRRHTRCSRDWSSDVCSSDLSEVTELTGGRSFSVEDINELPDIAAKIGMELRNQYVLGYRPSNKSHDARWRKIKIKLHAPKGLPPLTARSEEHTSELQSRLHLVCRLLLEKKKT